MAENGRACAVLFDLDGTFADTAPDMAGALNRLLHEQGRPPRAFEEIRPHVSHGGKALIRFGFDLEPEHPQFEPLRQTFLRIYSDNIANDTRLFPGMGELLDSLDGRAIPWGIVTNKPAWLTVPLMEKLGLAERAHCIVSGDTTAHAKPHPEPILHACRGLKIQPGCCWYLGDAERDIAAGRAAGARTLVALFGYLAEQDQPGDWGADGMIEHPLETLDWLDV
jgi:2-phosphoglycolate phosphatase